METTNVLRQLKKNNKINNHQFKTYMGQIKSGDESACIKGLMRKRLITADEAQRLESSYKLAYTE